MRTTFTFPSADGKTPVYAVEYTPDAVAPKAVLQLIHGMVEYIDRYQAFAEWLSRQGWAVVGHDHLGHGSTGRPEDWGYICEKEPAEILCRDIHRRRELAQQRFPGLPYVMLGYSMGSYLLRQYLTQNAEGLSGAVIMGTGFQPEAVTGAGLGLIRLKTALQGGRHHSRTVEKLTFGRDYQRYDMTGADPANSWLTKDTEIVRRYYADPRCTFRFTLNGYEALLTAVRDACSAEGAARIPKDLPILLVSGADDPVGAFGAGVRQTEAQLKKAGLTAVTTRLFAGDRHEILNETDRAAVAEYIADWLESAAFPGA